MRKEVFRPAFLSSASLQSQIHNLGFEDRKRVLLRTLREDECNNPTFPLFLLQILCLALTANGIICCSSPPRPLVLCPQREPCQLWADRSLMPGDPRAEQRAWTGAQVLGQALSCVWVVQGM